jgi:IS5 family transposase
VDEEARHARKHKLIRHYAETDASVHVSQKLDQLLDTPNTGSEVWAGNAYSSAETEAAPKSEG